MGKEGSVQVCTLAGDTGTKTQTDTGSRGPGKTIQEQLFSLSPLPPVWVGELSSPSGGSRKDNTMEWLSILTNFSLPLPLPLPLSVSSSLLPSLSFSLPPLSCLL